MATHTKVFGAAAVIVSTLLSFGDPLPAAAQSATPASSAPALRPTTDDVVHLRNGGFYRGRLSEIVPGDHVTIAIEGGESKAIAWDEVDRVVASTGPTTPPVVIPRATTALSPAPSPSPDTAPLPPTPETPASFDTPNVPTRPRTEWRANRPLLVTGAILFAVGYGPNVLAAAPSTAGVAGRFLVFVLTAGIAVLACIGSGNGYLCNGQHGAVQLLVPAIGPFLFAADHPRDTVLNERGRPLGDVAKGLLYTSAGLQIAGLGSILGAIVMGKHEPVAVRKTTSTTPSFFITPQGDATTVGISVGVHRW
jgi:hypothetical protein